MTWAWLTIELGLIVCGLASVWAWGSGFLIGAGWMLVWIVAAVVSGRWSFQ